MERAKLLNYAYSYSLFLYCKEYPYDKRKKYYLSVSTISKTSFGKAMPLPHRFVHWMHRKTSGNVSINT
jgi:hypothetical protein